VFLTSGNSTIQLTSDPAYRGRVTALWSLALVGSTPIGSPIIGAVSQLTSPRWALAVGAAACAAAAAIGHWPVPPPSRPAAADTEPVSTPLWQPEPLIQPGRSRTSYASSSSRTGPADARPDDAPSRWPRRLHLRCGSRDLREFVIELPDLVLSPDR
jgi:MFS family permease